MKEQGPNHIRNKIKAGKLPRYTLAKGKDDKPETVPTFKGPKRFGKDKDGNVTFVPRQKRTWRLICTKKLLGD